MIIFDDDFQCVVIMNILPRKNELNKEVFNM